MVEHHMVWFWKKCWFALRTQNYLFKINKNNYFVCVKITTETEVSLFSITCRRCGGKIGGPETFCHGADEGIS